MKTKIFFPVVVAILFTVSCTRNNSDLTADPSQVAVNGSWRVTLFTDSGNDETADFTSYSFVFNGNGTVTATKNAATQNGTWSVDTGSNRFNIDLGPKVDTNKPLGELTDDWKIISVSPTEIRLTDDNAASSEFLTFTKN